jgi:hypothetical protein
MLYSNRLVVALVRPFLWALEQLANECTNIVFLDIIHRPVFI